MSFIVDLTDFIASKTGLIVDTDLFIAGEPVDAPNKFAVVSESAGSFETESGLQFQPIQIITKDLTYLLAQALAVLIFNVLKNKPGFDTLSKVFYCEDVSMPFCLGQDARNRWLFSTNYAIRKLA